MKFDYAKLKESLLSQIEKGEYAPGSSIPSERDLCLNFEVSRTTVRKAIEDLVADKILIKKPGKGTFVSILQEQKKKRMGNILFLRCMHSDIKMGSFMSDDIFYPNVLSGLELSAEKMNYHCLVKSINENNPNLDILTSLLEKVDGIVCGELHSADFLNYLSGYDLPLVLVSPSVDTSETDMLVIDNIHGSIKSTEYLIERGHKRIAFIGGSPNSLPSEERKIGFLKAMEKAGLSVSPSSLKNTTWSRNDGAKAMDELMKGKNPPTAIIAASDLIALGVCDYIQDSKLAIADDISVVGFDGIYSAMQVRPILTTMYVRALAMGETAFKLFYEQINGQRDYPVKIAIPAELVPGETVGTWKE